MARFTVLLNPPEDLRSDSVEPFTSLVEAGNSEHALELALAEAAKHFNFYSMYDDEEPDVSLYFKTIAIFAGHLDNLA